MDESGVNRGLTRRYGRARKGKRVLESFDEMPRDKLTLISAIGLNGIVGSYEFKGAMTKIDFRGYCSEILIPELKIGSTLILDNLSSHKDIEDLFLKKGINLLYLPPYTPEYNPIEMMWSKIKNYLRKNRSENLDELKEIITKAYATISIEDIKGWFNHCGYEN